MTKAEPTEEARLLKEMQQQGKELGAINKRARQLMKKLPALTGDERAELDKFMGQDMQDRLSQLVACMSKASKATTKK